MKSLIFYVSVFYDLCKCLLFRFMGGFLLLTRLNERFNQHIICRLISLIVFRLQGVVRFLPFAMLFLKHFRVEAHNCYSEAKRERRLHRRRPSCQQTFFLVAPSETLYVRCRLRAPDAVVGRSCRRCEKLCVRTDPPDFTASRLERIRTLCYPIAGFRVARPRAFIGDSLAHRCFSVRI